MTQPPLQPRFGALWLLAFPKTKITFERGEISDHWWDSRKYDRAADGNWEDCVRSQSAHFEGNWNKIRCFLYIVYSSINATIFILHGWIPSCQIWYILIKWLIWPRLIWHRLSTYQGIWCNVVYNLNKVVDIFFFTYAAEKYVNEHSSWQNSQFLENCHLFYLCLTEMGYFPSSLSDLLTYWTDELHGNYNPQNILVPGLCLMSNQFMEYGFYILIF